jgi:hypothetical protein
MSACLSPGGIYIEPTCPTLVDDANVNAKVPDSGEMMNAPAAMGRARVRQKPVFVDLSGIRRRLTAVMAIVVAAAGALLLVLLLTAATAPGPVDVIPAIGSPQP